MAPDIILYIILGIITIDFMVDQLLDYLNHKSKRVDLPEEIASFYDESKYRKSQEYQKVSGKFSFITSSFSFIISFLMLSLGGFGYLDQLLRPYFDNEVWLSLAYFGVLYVVSDVVNLPFQWYSTFVIEERFGFNKTTPKTFVLDKLKGYVLSAVLGCVLIGALLYLILNIGENFWLYFWLVASVFILFVNMFYTSLILPLFNKLTPLEDGELKSAIQTYSEKIDFPLDSIYVIDGSKRSNKANAFFSGLGKKKKIVLYDTLINNHTNEELVAILAHEVGHFKKKHILYGFAISILQIGVMLFLMSKMIYNENLSLALGAEQMGVHLNLLAFGLLYSPISTLLGIAMNIFSRKNEYEADAFARDTYNGDSLSTALKKLSVDNLSNLYPHPAYVFVNYSHPPLLARLAAISKR
ncbi:M48 family metallopeptidase [Fulvivirga sediminis]|uniref:M48 family metallopeptidase n=1 Tax=Fulvivirga sediminis TaxID=2803949 RepID=A0A937K316_9BACT|nr:M48 family metallopeptidase [Fulvivirga sediminis]MBL3658467.1 M48 family metallopeptidase [Fulvivirga sediminis]